MAALKVGSKVTFTVNGRGSSKTLSGKITVLGEKRHTIEVVGEDGKTKKTYTPWASQVTAA